METGRHTAGEETERKTQEWLEALRSLDSFTPEDEQIINRMLGASRHLGRTTVFASMQDQRVAALESSGNQQDIIEEQLLKIRRFFSR
jgi:hypothetical protein